MLETKIYDTINVVGLICINAVFLFECGLEGMKWRDLWGKIELQNPATLKWITVVEFNCDISKEGTLSDHFMVCLKLYSLILSNYVVALTLWVSGTWSYYCYLTLLVYSFYACIRQEYCSVRFRFKGIGHPKISFM